MDRSETPWNAGLNLLAGSIERMPFDHLKAKIRTHIEASLKGNWPNEKGFGYAYVCHALRGLGFTKQETTRLVQACLKTEAVLKACGGKVAIDAGPSNLLMILKIISIIEKSFPTAARILTHDFGIVNFDHIPAEWISDQIVERGNKTTPYILVLRQANVAYKSVYRGFNHDILTLSRLRDEAHSKGLIVRIAEFTHDRDCLRILNRMGRLYGSQDQKGFKLGNVSMVLLDTHGVPEKLATSIDGNTNVISYLTAEQIKNSKAVAKLGTGLPEDCPIVISACNSAANGPEGQSIGQAIASSTGRATYAAPVWPNGSVVELVTLDIKETGAVLPRAIFSVKEGDNWVPVPATTFYPKRS